MPEALAAVQGGAERTAGSSRKLESREVSSLAGLEFRDRRDCMTPKVRFLELWSILFNHHLHQSDHVSFADPAGCSP